MRLAFAFVVIFTLASDLIAQTFEAGSLTPPTGSFGTGPITAIDLSSPPTSGGVATAATFFWSTGPCPATVKIKVGTGVRNPSPPALDFLSVTLVDERGPLPVQALGSPQTVSLVPPLEIPAGAVIGISGLTSCGGPASGQPADPNRGTALVPHEWKTTELVTISSNLSLELRLSDDTLSLLNQRFRVTLTATDPRSGRVTTGRGITQGDRYGYFSLPEFTGDPTFPEVIVKMADATSSPAPFGGAFWFFYSALTDVEYTLLVEDQVTHRARIYASSPSAGGQFCGAGDTNAFPRDLPLGR